MTAATFLDSEDDQVDTKTSTTGSTSTTIRNEDQSMPPLPSWVEERRSTWGEKLIVGEWEQDDGTYRSKHGWKGHDLIHDKNAPVRVLEYHVNYGKGIPGTETAIHRGGAGTTLTGVVHFTKRAESHQGMCHGGSMCSVLDDVIGWVAFLVTGSCRPWTGFTVQINTQLKKPIVVDSILLVQATITSVVRRKVAVVATILDPAEEETSEDDDDDDDDDEQVNDNNKRNRTAIQSSSRAIHATGEGLVILNRGVIPEATTTTTL